MKDNLDDAMKSRLRSTGATLLAALMAAICLFATTAVAGTPVRLALQWYPQTQFAGYYMALEKGIYAQHGLDVTILPGDADCDPIDRVASGKADFCTTFLSSAIRRRAEGVPLVNVGQIVQRSALMLVTRKGSGIKTIKDLNGARVGTWGGDFQLQPKALFQRENLDVTFVRQSPSFELFMRGGLDAALAMWYNEYHTLLAYGLNSDEMQTFFFSDLDLNEPEDGIYCTESTLKASPETAAALVRASAEGWEYAFAHPEETVRTLLSIMKQAKIRANKAHQTWMLSRMQNIILKEGQNRLDTSLNYNDFEGTKKMLFDTGFIDTDIAYGDFYKGAAQ